jgi:hypothetical protein
MKKTKSAAATRPKPTDEKTICTSSGIEGLEKSASQYRKVLQYELGASGTPDAWNHKRQIVALSLRLVDR